MATAIRTHVASPNGESTGSGTTVAGTIAAATSPGNTLIAVISGDDRRTVSGLTKPGGETASWVKVSPTPTDTGSGAVFTEIWAIKTTVAWTLGFTITATISASCTGRSLNVMEFAGVSTTVSSSQSKRHYSAPNLTVTTGSMVPGDLVIAAGAVPSGGSASLFGQYGQLNQPDAGATAAGTIYGADRHRPNPAWLTSMASTFGITGAGSVDAKVLAFTYSGSTISLNSAPMVSVIVGLQSDDYPPDTPTLTSMASGGVVNRAATNRASHTFSSPNYVDSQSKFDLRYRLVGDPTWTTILAAGTTALYCDFASGSLTAGDYEQQVKVYGALGQASDWSTSGYFTAADAPDGPTITYPTSGQMLDQFETVAWSTPDGQDSYQLRRVADDAGDPDPAMIYQDTGEVVDSTTRALGLNFSVNGRAEHIQLRVKVDSLWSEWDDVPVDVSYTPPPTPTRTLYPNTGSFLAVFTNPDPEEGDPAAVSNNIWIDDGKGLERRAVGVPTNGSWVYETPISGRDYGLPGRFIVEAVAANGTTARSGS